MSDELRAAAERLRRYEAGERMADVYGTEIHAWDQMYRMDVHRVAQAYLAEHPEDDDVEIDESWLTVVGKWDADGCNFDLGPVDNLILQMEDDVAWLCSDDTVPVRIGVKENRGSVRRLCRALGVELKEPAT